MKYENVIETLYSLGSYLLMGLTSVEFFEMFSFLLNLSTVFFVVVVVKTPLFPLIK